MKKSKHPMHLRDFNTLAPSTSGMNGAYINLMPRKPRYVLPDGSHVVEVTTRTIQSMFLLKPSEEFNEIALGVLGRTLAEVSGVKVLGFTVMSNHYVKLLHVRDAKALSDFMAYFNGNLAKEACRQYGWGGKLWSRRYTDIEVVDEEAMVKRLRYVIAHGAKEGLVESPKDWPGAKCLPALLEGKTICGAWFDRTAEYRARQRGEKYDKYEYATFYDVPLSPLPCWEDLSEQEQQKACVDMVADIEREAMEVNRLEGRTPIGPEAILAQNPLDRPRTTKRSPAPLCHASSRAARVNYREVLGMFLEDYGKAAHSAKDGRADEAIFPQGCFPPAMPFVPICEGLSP